jgi:hypothetical protein
MAAKPARWGRKDPNEPVIHELPPLVFEGEAVPLRLAVRRTEDGTWRARLVFGSAEIEQAPATAEIFCSANESELWQAVRELPHYHMCDLYRSLAT